MKFTRNAAIKLNFLINELLPPILRDKKFIMYIPMKILLKDTFKIFFEFRDKAFYMTDEEYSQAYKDTDIVNLLKVTDLNDLSIDAIRKEVVGVKILEVGCGRGFLSNILIREGFQLSAIDIMETEEVKKLNLKSFKIGMAENIPFQDSTFDTVVCTHVLEHVRNIHQALSELRRVSQKRIIIVVPKERPYRFGFNLHLTFFPYKFNVLSTFNPDPKKVNFTCKNVGGDWFYIEDKK